MNINDLTPEQRARAMECQTPEELAALAQEYGIGLSSEEISFSGAEWNHCSSDCPDDDDLPSGCPNAG